jgi:hypothetical protein
MIQQETETGTPFSLTIMPCARPERTNGMTAAMKTRTAETFFFHDQNASAGARCQNCGVFAAGSRSNDNQLV